MQSNSKAWEGLLAGVSGALGARYAVLDWEDGGEILPLSWWGRAQPPQGHEGLARLSLSQAWPLVLEAGQAIAGCPVAPEELPLLCIPLDSQRNSRGVLILGLPPGQEGLGQRLPLAELLAKLMAEMAALKEELSGKEEQVRELIRTTLEVQEAERERICLEVHDGVTQTLASAFHYLQTLEASSPETSSSRQLLLRASSLVRQAIQESREVINSLQPTALRDLGLVATLRQEMRQLEAETGWKVEFMADPIRLPSDMETGLYRIIREAVANAQKHSATTRLRLQLKQQGGRIVVEIKDWGVGFIPFTEKRKSPGLGFHSMRQRASLWGGNCAVESSPGQGTTVRVEIPTQGEER